MNINSLLLMLAIATAAVGSLSGENIVFPPESGVIDVTKAYDVDSADNGHDDTAGIQKAVAENIHKGRVLYFPNGVYNISAPIDWKREDGQWETTLTFQGQSRAGTIFKLKDGVFTDPENPQAVLVTASQNPNSPSGSGNQAFMNNLRNFTVDTGKGNPGAIGIRYHCNNAGQLVSILIRSGSPDKAGVTGLDMTRAWPGPCLIKNVAVDGFDVGIDINHFEYSVTLEHIALRDQKVAGIRNQQNVVSVRGLTSRNAVPAYLGEDESALVALMDAVCEGGASGSAAIQFKGGLIARNVKTSGYRSAIRDNNSKKDVAGGTVQEFVSHAPVSLSGTPGKALNLPVEETPAYESGMDDWVFVDDAGEDDTEAFRAAIAQANREGKGTVALKSGRDYHVSDTIVVSGGIRRIAGLMCGLRASGRLLKSTDMTTPVFRFENLTGPSITVDEMTLLPFAQDNKGVKFTWFEHATKTPLVVNNITCFIGAAYRNTVEGGKVFIEDAAIPGWFFKNQQVWARQLNPEFYTRPLISNEGPQGRFWVLGLKTEGGYTLVETRDGASTEVYGGIVYPIDDPGDAPCFLIENARASLSYSNTGKVSFRNYIEEIRAGKTETVSSAVTRDLELPRGGKVIPLFIGTGR